mgnify:CR=1 FL=1
MSIATIVLGESGTGKSTSLRNLDPANTLLIQVVKKPLPFKNNWKPVTKENPKGNIYVTDSSATIVKAIEKTDKEIIVIDDFQYIMTNEFMRRVLDKEAKDGVFAKYNEIAKNVWDVLNAASSASDNKRVYMLSHVETTDGRDRVKTIGKLLDEKVSIEGMVSIVLRSRRTNGNYLFATQNNGLDTTKSPMGLFTDELIENDLAAVDAAICEYYDINQTAETTA